MGSRKSHQTTGKRYPTLRRSSMCFGGLIDSVLIRFGISCTKGEIIPIPMGEELGIKDSQLEDEGLQL